MNEEVVHSFIGHLSVVWLRGVKNPIKGRVLETFEGGIKMRDYNNDIVCIASELITTIKQMRQTEKLYFMDTEECEELECEELDNETKAT